MKRSLFILCILILFTGYSDDSKNKIKNDVTLIVPGLGAERAILEEETIAVIRVLRGYSYKLSRFSKEKELFKTVFNVRTKVRIPFDKIYYFNDRKAIFFSRRGTVSAIIGLSAERVTIDSINLRKGADFFILNYGNKGLSIIEKGTNKIYLYYDIGIAIVDDKADDAIDMYIIFPGRGK